MRREGIEPPTFCLKALMSFGQDLSVDNPSDRGDILFYILIISRMGEINNKSVWELRDPFVL